MAKRNKQPNLIGLRFGRLVVISSAPKNNHGDIMWDCVCDCGNHKVTCGWALLRGKTKSCGCLFQESVRLSDNKHKKHGGYGTRLYKVWRSMKSRCYYTKSLDYSNYGGRGIVVCDEWQEFEPFRDWALANGYDENAEYGQCTLDRINTDGNYCPENCRWVSEKTQGNNRRNNRMITAFEKTLTLAQWADNVGLKKDTLRRRIENGWDIEVALTTPVKQKEKI